jgi:secreted Zn-dependent insulinase-like peptidase
MQVPNDSKPLMSIKGAGYPFERSVMCFAPSIKERHQVFVTFQLPSLQQQYDKKCDEYLSHLIGHEGPGSLLSELRSRNWATEVCAGALAPCRWRLNYDDKAAAMQPQETRMHATSNDLVQPVSIACF